MPGVTPGQRRIVRFGSFEVDIHAGELRKSGVRVPLQEQPFRLLTILLDHPGELTTREQLQRELWAGDTFVDFERGLNTAIKRVRDALGDDADTPRFVETLPRRGYRFVAPVAEADAVMPDPLSVLPIGVRSRTRVARWLAISFGILATAVVASLAVVPGARRETSTWSGVTRLQLPVVPAARFGASPARTIGGTKTNLALSPDGRTLVFVGTTDTTRQLYVRKLDRETAVPLARTSGAQEPFFSPDGGWIGFWADGFLRKVSLDGGQVTTICEVDRYPPMGATWVGSEIVFARALGPLLRVSEGGGTPVPFTTVRRGEFGHRLPHALPGARAVLFTVRKRDYTWGNEEIAVQSLAGGAHTPLLGGTDGRYAASGHIVFLRLGTLMAVPFDVRRQRLIGNAVPIVNDVAESAAETSTQTVSGAGQFAISDTGVLAFVRGGVAPNRLSRLIWLDRQGRVTPVDLPPGLYVAPRLSPDGRRVAWFGWETTRSNIWIHDFERGSSARLPSEDEDSWPIWSPDGREVTYQSVSGGEWVIRRRPADGTGSPTILTDGPSVTPTSWSVDGKVLGLTLMQQIGSRHPEGDVFTWRTGGRSQPQPQHRTDADEQHLEFSPVSPHYAYVSDESGQREVYVAAIEHPETRFQVSASGGDVPVWSKSGRELMFVAPGSAPETNRVMVAAITTTSALHAGMPRLLFESPEAASFVATRPGRNYDLTPDGQRFLTSELEPLPPDRGAMYIDVVLNWFDELRIKAPPAR